jgi:arylsulfatase A-like enzyme
MAVRPPTRAALLTGGDQQRLRLDRPSTRTVPGYAATEPRSRTALLRILSDKRLHHQRFGKWRLTTELTLGHDVFPA